MDHEDSDDDDYYYDDHRYLEPDYEHEGYEQHYHAPELYEGSDYYGRPVTTTTSYHHREAEQELHPEHDIELAHRHREAELGWSSDEELHTDQEEYDDDEETDSDAEWEAYQRH